MRILETVQLKFLRLGDYFQFKGREQMYWVISEDNGILVYQSTYSGRKYTVNFWSRNAQKPVEILEYGI